MLIQNPFDLTEKLSVLSDAAKYDAACTSSGTDRHNNGKGIGNSKACGICHSFSQDGRCISLLKILLTNECIFDCRYCMNRASNDRVRTTFTPEEICSLTIEFYRRNYIEGLFLSSGILKSPDHTMKLLAETAMLLRTRHHFGGYIHLKAIPGAAPHLIEMAGWYADRMSVNLELPTAQGLQALAPHKSRQTILTPMRQIQNGILQNQTPPALTDRRPVNGDAAMIAPVFSENAAPAPSSGKPQFVPAGQSTQMIIGATPESDYQIVTVAEALYQKYHLKRVFYSAFVNVNRDASLPTQERREDVPLLREHRLYQADWLMRCYGFRSGELLSEDKPNFNVLLDPKCDWALRHLELFPVEINRADYRTLLRIPGVGVHSARRIVKARRICALDFADLKKIGVVLKRAIYFITCSGRMMHPTPIDEDYITRQLVGADRQKIFELEQRESYKQLSLFDDSRRIPM